MKRLFLSLILGVVAVVGSVWPVPAQSNLFDSAFEKSQAENFEGAIDDLLQANIFFWEQKDWENVYQSTALIAILTHSLDQKNALEAGETLRSPEWYKLGSCMGGNDICEYSVVWATPETTGTDFEGILVLQKHLRYIPNPEGGAISVQAIVDAEVVPKLKGGEWLGTNCNLKGREDVPILGIYQTRGFYDAEEYTQIRKAWRVNITTQTIETISPSNVVCINPCPGGC